MPDTRAKRAGGSTPLLIWAKCSIHPRRQGLRPVSYERTMLANRHQSISCAKALAWRSNRPEALINNPKGDDDAGRMFKTVKEGFLWINEWTCINQLDKRSDKMKGALNDG